MILMDANVLMYARRADTATVNHPYRNWLDNHSIARGTISVDYYKESSPL